MYTRRKEIEMRSPNRSLRPVIGALLLFGLAGCDIRILGALPQPSASPEGTALGYYSVSNEVLVGWSNTPIPEDRDLDHVVIRAVSSVDPRDNNGFDDRVFVTPKVKRAPFQRSETFKFPSTEFRATVSGLPAAPATMTVTAYTRGGKEIGSNAFEVETDWLTDNPDSTAPAYRIGIQVDATDTGAKVTIAAARERPGSVDCRRMFTDTDLDHDGSVSLAEKLASTYLLSATPATAMPQRQVQCVRAEFQVPLPQRLSIAPPQPPEPPRQTATPQSRQNRVQHPITVRFDALDTNGDRRLTPAEFCGTPTATPPPPSYPPSTPPGQACDPAFARADANQDGRLDRGEYLASIEAAVGVEPRMLPLYRAMAGDRFARLDQNQDQSVDGREFCTLGSPVACDGLLTAMDADGDGWASWREFLAYLQAHDVGLDGPAGDAYKQQASDLYDALDRNDNQELTAAELCPGNIPISQQ